MKGNLRYLPAFLAAVALYFWDVPVKGLILAVGDGLSQFYPMMAAVSEQYKDLSFPFWNPYVFSGFPLMAAVQYGVLYPPTVILNLLFSPPTAYNLNMVLHFSLAGFFTFLYARRLGLEVVPSASAGLLFSLLGYLPAHLQHYSIIFSGAWMPLVFYFYEGLRQKPGLRSALYASLAIALQVFAGHPQICLYTNIILFVFVLFHLYYLRPDERLRFAGYSALAFALGLLIALPQAAATYELASLGPRAATTYEFFSEGSIGRDVIPSMAFPFIFGGSEGFIGTVPFFIAIYAYIKVEGRNLHVKFWGLVAVVTFILALGDALRPLNKIMFHVPAYNYFRAPSKHLLEVCFSLSVLAGFGISYLQGREKIRQYRFFLIFLVSAALFSVLSITVFRGIAGYGSGGGVKTPYIALAVMLGYIACFSLSGRVRKYLIPIIPLLIIAEASAYKVEYNHPADYAASYNRELFEFLSADKQNRAAFITLNVPDSQLSVPYGISSIDGYDPLHTGDYAKLLDMRMSGYSDAWPALIENNVILSMLNAKYLVVDGSYGDIGEIKGRVARDENGQAVFVSPFGRGLPHSGDYMPVYKKVFEKRDVIVYENLNALPRAFHAKTLKAVDTLEEIKLGLYAFQLDPARDAAVAVADLREIGRSDFSEGEAKITDYKPGAVRLRTDFPGAGFVVLSDQYYPGWRAYIDGRRTRIYKADGVLRGVVVPEGRHELLFKYVPVKIYAAMALSVTVLAGMVLLIVFKN